MRDARLAAKTHRPVGAGHHRAAAQLQTGEHAVEGHRLRSEDVGPAEASLPAPQVGLHDQSESLIARSGCGRGKGEAQIRLGGGVAGRIRTLHRSGPTGHPFLARLRERGGGEEKQRQDTHIGYQDTLEAPRAR